MDKKTLIALAMIFVVFWLSNELIWKKRTPEVQPQIRQESVTPVEHTGREVAEKQDRKERALPVMPGLSMDEDVEINDRIVLSNDKITIHFSNLGGMINKVYLNDYLFGDKENIVNLIPEDEKLLGLAVKTDDGMIDFSRQIFKWNSTFIDGYQAVLFYIENEAGKIVEKRYILAGDYTLLFDLGIRNLGETDGYVLSFSSGIADTEEALKQKDNDYQIITQVQGIKKSITLRNLKKNSSTERVDGNINWAAVRSKYFIQVLIPEERLQTYYLDAFESNDSPAYDLYVKPGRVPSVTESSYQLYLGPLVYGNLESFGVGLEEVMELGWKFIRPLGKLFLWVLINVNRFVPNYGITIILFALILKIVLYPLTHKSFHSMQKMQKMQPYMQEIQRKYKSDPKKMQEELKKLYKEHGTNPMGGCFPMLLQMPVFFALYPVLRYSIELRQASFVFWITDLSEPDPLMILPILMGLFMFVQQKMSAQNPIDKDKMDEKQLAAMQSQKMMLYIMPVFMVFIFRGLPSGLVLYWTIFNVFSIVQQYYIKKQLAN